VDYIASDEYELLGKEVHAEVRTQAAPPDLVLEGKIMGAQNLTHLEIPFAVPASVHRISVDFGYTGKENRTALDLGIADPERFRGESRNNKSHVTIGESDATPSYLPGAIPAGQWKLLLSVANICPTETSTYRADIRFNTRAEDQSFADVPLEKNLRWYRGDRYTHTGNSDANCNSQSGKPVPCPVFLSALNAAQRGLDFIAITDHNVNSQNQAIRELQPYFDRVLLIPGREMTTFWGHFNIYGVTGHSDYRTVARNGLSIDEILRQVHEMGGIASVNHADSPGSEQCLGCAWEPPFSVDYSQFTGVEVVNGGHSMLSSADF
jgi:hypothetical protein